MQSSVNKTLLSIFSVNGIVLDNADGGHKIEKDTVTSQKEHIIQQEEQGICSVVVISM
jgi:hypothetical protein